ncbi:hypothetical protein MASSI9I_51184 [Massilia sp. 9I]|nr:hypothetical protein MASSI9I_51184 [Massilia sp. 9I]
MRASFVLILRHAIRWTKNLILAKAKGRAGVNIMLRGGPLY